MKILKIDIKKQEVDVPDNFNSFEETLFSPTAPIILDDGIELPPGLTHTIRYKVAEVKSFTGDKQYYAVKINDANLFVDLLTVAAEQYITIEEHNKRLEMFKQIIVDETRNKVTEETEKIVKVCKSDIKKLAWWKRLFNLF